MLLNLGEPDSVLLEEKAFIYNWEGAVGYAMVGGLGGGSIRRTHLVEIFFDDQGTVCSFEVKAGVSLSLSDEIKRIEKGPPCPSTH